jgi:hypothetical protein
MNNRLLGGESITVEDRTVPSLVLDLLAPGNGPAVTSRSGEVELAPDVTRLHALDFLQRINQVQLATI